MKTLPVLLLFVLSFTFTACAQPKSFYKADSTETWIKPPHLQPGDSVVVVAPSGILKANRKAEVNRGIDLLESWGLNVKVGDNVYKQYNHFAGTDDERAYDFQKALNNPNISAIWCARGGYGAVRVLDKLDFTAFKKNPKWLIGYSDITALHNLFHNAGYQSIHGMMAVSLSDDNEGLENTIASFKSAIFGESIAYDVPASNYNRPGTANAPVVGGNLTLLHTMLGSSTSLNTDGKILFIEDIGEYKYHIDRMLQSLKRAGYFKNCKGLLVGDFSNLRVNTTAWGQTIEELILDVVAEYDFPVMFNVPAGHEKDNRALILGEAAKITVSKDGENSIVFKR